MSMIEIQSLFDQPVSIITKRLTAEESFAQFLRRNPKFIDRLAELAYEMKLRGQRPSAKALFELVRGDVHPVPGQKWELNNTWSSLAADRLVEKFPDLGIERRKRRSA